MRSQRGARSHVPSIRNGARRLWRLSTPVLAVTLWGGCGEGDQREIRQWRPEDHQAPPAMAEDGRAEPKSLDPADEARIASALWTARCARCHGATGRGDGSGAPPGAPLPNFADPAFHAKRSNEELALVVVQGRNLMPAFEGELGAREIALLVAHVRAFAQSDEPAGAAPTGDAPTQEEGAETQDAANSADAPTAAPQTGVAQP